MKKVFIIFMVSMLVGCASVSRWEPTLNTMPNKNAANAEKDLAECRVLADKAAGFGMEGVEGAVGGAAGGAAEGAIIGAMIGGSAGPVAAIAAPMGGIAGLWYSEYEANLVFKRAYSNCLFQRGQFPIN